MFGKLFGKKVNDAKVEMKKIERRDLMEAICAGSLLVAAADGKIEPEEIAKLDELVRSNPSLSHFGNEITSTINRISAQLNANYQVGKLAAKRELADIKNVAADAEEVFVNMIAIATSDGEVEPQELAVLKEIGLQFGLRAADYGIEG
jgi:tellurite resistance protein TerB